MSPIFEGKVLEHFAHFTMESFQGESSFPHWSTIKPGIKDKSLLNAQQGYETVLDRINDS